MAKHAKTANTVSTSNSPTLPALAAAIVATTTSPTAAGNTAHQPTVTYFTVVAPKRPLTGLKYGLSGNAYTHAQLAAAQAANGGQPLTNAQAYAVCVQCNHKGFYAYAINRLRVLVPVAAPAVVQ